MNKVYSKVIYIVISILLIINSATIYMTENFNRCIVAMAGVLIAYNIICVFTYATKLKKVDCWSAMLVAFLITILFILWKHVYAYGVYVLGILFPNIWLMIKIQEERNKVKEFLEALVKVSVGIAILSLLFWIAGSIFGFIKPTAIVPIRWGHNIRYIKSYYGLYFEAQNAAIDLGWVRLGVKNDSFFLEAPICAYVCIVVFIINEKINLKKKKAIRILLLIMILSTLTTTGVLFVSCVMVYFVSGFQPRSNFEKVLKWIIYTIIVVIAAGIISSLLREKSVSYSGNIRFSKMQDEFKAFLNNPISGNGFNTYTDGSSNSITALLADGGILLWMIYYIPLIKLMAHTWKNRRYDALLIIYIFTFAITVVQYTPICIFMLMWYTETIKGGINNDFNNCSDIQ